MATHPGGVSTRQPKHFIQLKDSGKFQLYDFGKEGNQITYGQSWPPDYPLEKVDPMTPIHLFYSDGDHTVSSEDIPILASKLPRSVLHKIEKSKWDHSDFIIGNTVDEVLNLPIINIINEFEKN
nr:lipase 3-like [Drosophila takahashii]